MSKYVCCTFSSMLSVVALCSVGLVGCGGSGSSPGQNQTLAPAVAAAVKSSMPVDANLVAADNSFGFDLFNQLIQQAPNQNVFISPTSVALALEIVENGAGGSTLTAMEQTLHLSGTTVSDVNTANAALQASLVNPDPKVALTIANSLWLQNSPAANNPFVQANTTYYGSTIGSLAGAPNNVNAWVASKTDGAITSILPPGNYSQTPFVLVNAIYFDGQWTTQFDPTQTTPAPFTLLDGTTTTCEMMHQTGNYSYYSGSNFQVVSLPYGSGRTSMVVVLPNKGADWQSFLANISLQNLNTWLTQSVSSPVVISLPRFQSDYSANLDSSLSTLGMGIVFTLQADFSGIAPGVFIKDVLHKTYLKVDEQGTVAAGATAIIGNTAGSGALPMTMDHPFFCAIRDNKTGALLFLGCILNPAAVSSS